MVCGMQGRIARRENLLSGHDRFLLLKDEAEYIIDNMAAMIKKNWYNYFRREGVSDKDCETIASAFLHNGFFYLDDVP
jgi:hypothetical protein